MTRVRRRYAPEMVEPGAQDGPDPARPVDVVASFLAGVTPADLPTAMARYAAPDLRFHNVGLPTIRSAATATRVLRANFRLGTGFVIRTHHLAADGPVVLTDRTDVLLVGRTEAAFHVSGTFEVRDGRITVWRDHFDAASVAAAHVAAFLRAGAGALRSSR
jgi:limonene-1,2-epoxide hydrolase